MGTKKAEFYADFKSVELIRKVRHSIQVNCQKVSPISTRKVKRKLPTFQHFKDQ